MIKISTEWTDPSPGIPRTMEGLLSASKCISIPVESTILSQTAVSLVKSV